MTLHGKKILREHAALLAIVVAGGILAWQRYFIIDDAFISFTYARHFAEGHGLVWYPGSTEFGYTNFLFTLLVGCLMWLGFPALAAAFLISVPCYLAAVVAVYDIVRRMAVASRVAACGAAASLAVHYTVSSYATSGLETSLHMLLIVLVYRAAFLQQARGQAVLVSLALLCRLDSALLLIPALLYGAWNLRRDARQMAILVGVPAAVLVVFLLGCNAFYQSALPNTFYAKINLPRSFVPEGWEYVRTFLSANRYAPVLAACVAMLAWVQARPSGLRVAAIGCTWAAVAVWIAYIVYIGGDFMEFRLMVPALPLFYIGVFVALSALTPRMRHAALALVTSANLVVGLLYAPHFFRTPLVGSLPVMHEQLTNPRHNWQMVGEAFGELFHTGKDEVRIALMTVGAIAYYSRLYTVDMYGLNDRWVAQHGVPGNRIAGHRKKAPLSYLQQQGVHLVIPSLPVYVCGETKKENLRSFHGLPIVLIPLASGCKVVAYYLRPHPWVETLIHYHQVERVP